MTHSKYRKYGSRLKIITDDENDKDIINISKMFILVKEQKNNFKDFKKQLLSKSVYFKVVHKATVKTKQYVVHYKLR